MPLLSVERLVAGYGAIVAVKGISLSVEEGEIVTLIGSNGAGKSTTLRTISGLIRPREGDIRFLGQSIVGVPPHRIVGMGIAHVPEGRGIFGTLTVEENLFLGAHRRLRDPSVKDDLERVYQLFPRLRERRKQIAGTLSGGEQQMLAIGRGLMARPRVLLLDEPSMGLAPVLVDAIFDTIAEIRAQGTPILLVEQNAAAALSIADRGYVIESGRIVLEGTGKELAQNDDVRRAYLGEL